MSRLSVVLLSCFTTSQILEYGKERRIEWTINVIQLLARIVDTMTEVEKRTYIFRHGSLFILFLCVQLLIVIVDIDLLMLSDVDTVEVISHILRSQSTDNMFMLAELDSNSYQTHSCWIRAQPIKVFLQSNPVLILKWHRDKRFAIHINGRIRRRFWRTFFQVFNEEQRRWACRAAFILSD